MQLHGDGREMGGSAVLGALESLRGLSEERLDAACTRSSRPFLAPSLATCGRGCLGDSRPFTALHC
eukprot:COSAG06_NODE_69450_length_197_cov_856.887755_1_plen_65_part_11